MKIIMFTTMDIVQLVVYAVSIGSMYGALRARLVALEKKQDKHNCLIERMAKVEMSANTSEERIDKIEERILYEERNKGR